MVNTNIKKRRWLLLAAASVLLLTGCSSDNSLDNLLNVFDQITGESSSVINPDLPKNELIPVEFEKHVDGDTSYFVLNGSSTKVRYLLIDTPETVKQGTDPQPYGHEASERTKQLLTSAEKIEIMLDQGDTEDHYGRILAYVFVDGDLLQDILIREGLARIAYVSEPSTKYLEILQTSQEQAKNAKLGIWSIEGYVSESGFSN